MSAFAPRELSRGRKAYAPKSPVPADAAALQTLVTRLHEAADNAKCRDGGPIALHVLSTDTREHPR